MSIGPSFEASKRTRSTRSTRSSKSRIGQGQQSGKADTEGNKALQVGTTCPTLNDITSRHKVDELKKFVVIALNLVHLNGCGTGTGRNV